MLKKPQDLLEFFRRSSGERPEAAAPRDLEKTPRMLVVRRSQAVVAAVSAGLGLVLAFLLGLGLGSGSSEPAVAGGLWVIKVVAYEDNEKGRHYAKTVMSQLERLDLGDEVNLRRVIDDRKLAVTVGSWISNPRRVAHANELLKKVKGIRGRGDQGQPFVDADFWRIER